MKRVTSLGGVFFKTPDPGKTRSWYSRHLGMNMEEHGTHFEWYKPDDAEQPGYTLWSPFKESTQYFGESGQQYMLNFRVEDLEALLEVLRQEGVEVLDTYEEHDYGKFAHIIDGDGNRVELWEPNDRVYGKMINGITKQHDADH